VSAEPTPAADGLEATVAAIIERLAASNVAREEGLAGCRTLIRLAATAIRAVHRGEFERAAALLEEARAVHDALRFELAEYPAVYHAGFLHDAQKEYVEACVTFRLLSDAVLPGPGELGVEDPAYLNGLAEAVGELRRWLLDGLRQGRSDGAEAVLSAMDDIYTLLITVDFPDALTGNLRRATDSVRGILERTRGDLTMALVQERAATRMERAAVAGFGAADGA
jgi:translin